MSENRDTTNIFQFGFYDDREKETQGEKQIQSEAPVESKETGTVNLSRQGQKKVHKSMVEIQMDDYSSLVGNRKIQQYPGCLH